jgi:hypothetical protein
MRGSLAIKTEQPRHHDWGQAAEDGGGDIVRKGDPSKRASTQRIPGMVERANEMHLAGAGIGIGTYRHCWRQVSERGFWRRLRNLPPSSFDTLEAPAGKPLVIDRPSRNRAQVVLKLLWTSEASCWQWVMKSLVYQWPLERLPLPLTSWQQPNPRFPGSQFLHMRS